MLPKNRRISKSEFKYILQHGKRVNSPSFLVYISPINSDFKDKSRFSFSVSKKVHKDAVKRNLLRRWGYSSVSHIIKSVKDGYYIFFVYKSCKDLSYETVRDEVSELLYKLDVIS